MTAPAMARPECPFCGRYWDDLGEPDWAPPRSSRRWWRVIRRVRRLLAIVTALGVLGAVMFAGLLLITPSVGDAPALARALAQAHRAPFPGQPAPLQFTASLAATEDHGLYQQLARMLYTPVPAWPGVTAEAEQVALAVKLAVSYPKAEILQLYSDVAYFGHGYYGLDEASCGYFGVPSARLTWPQAALLAGVLSAPLTGDPITHFAVARTGQAHVLARLAATGVLTRVQAGRVYRQPLRVEDGGHAGCGPR